MDLSVVIVNYQTFDLTRNTINSILKYEYPFSYEIIVVDNASEDNSLIILKIQLNLFLQKKIMGLQQVITRV